MTTIRQEDFIQSVADAFQFISFYHPADYIRDLWAAYQREESPAAKDAMAQILVNSRMAAEGHRPICQDTGIAIVFIRAGMDVKWDTKMSLEQLVNEGVRRAYTDKDNPLRASMLADPDGKRKSTGDNTPAVTHVELVPGDKVEVICAAKGGGSENKSKFAMLLPSDSIVDWVLSIVPTMGADWCPPGLLSLGIGGSPEKAMLMAKWAMMEPLNIHELKARGASTRAEELRLELYEKVNALGIGAQGLGGLVDGARREGRGLSDARRFEARGAPAQLRRHAPRALRPRRQRSREARSALARRLAEAHLRYVGEPPREPRHAHEGARSPRGRPAIASFSAASSSRAATPRTSAWWT